jgi:SAM-dependent methyltransferase
MNPEIVQMNNETIFLEEILSTIQKEDSLHYKKVKKNIELLLPDHSSDFYKFLRLIHEYCQKRDLSPEKIARDYLKMVNDMRVEGMYFKKHRKYSCENQQQAYEKVYSNKDIMGYYMNALLLSQLLWVHHFKMLMFFNNQLNEDFLKNTKIVLDVGPGHGFFSYLINEKLKSINTIDIVDISDGSLEMTHSIIGHGNGKIKYFNRDIFKYESSNKYDLIILGEVLEHLDDPLLILKKLHDLLNSTGYLWLTTPTNAPALDHVYLFRTKEDILQLLNTANFNVEHEFGCFAEDVAAEIAHKFDISYLYGSFLKKHY